MLVVGLVSFRRYETPFKNEIMKEIAIDGIIACIFAIFAIMVSGVLSFSNSKLKECQCIDLPSNVLIHEESKSGTKIYWMEFDKIGKIEISPFDARAYKAGRITLQLVKWYDESNETYIYTIRRKKGNKPTTNIDLLTIFEE